MIILDNRSLRRKRTPEKLIFYKKPVGKNYLNKYYKYIPTKSTAMPVRPGTRKDLNQIIL
jgi:hypothetical protein